MTDFEMKVWKAYDGWGWSLRRVSSGQIVMSGSGSTEDEARERAATQAQAQTLADAANARKSVAQWEPVP